MFSSVALSDNVGAAVDDDEDDHVTAVIALHGGGSIGFPGWMQAGDHKLSDPVLILQCWCMALGLAL